MSASDMTPFTPDEALHAFMDGELDLSEEQQLFDSLANSPDLRTEMKDALAIRDAVHHDLLAPPAAAESGLLAGLGFTSGAGAGGAFSASGAVAPTAGTSSAWLSKTLFSVGGGIAGFLLAWTVMNTSDDTNRVGPADVKTGPSVMQSTAPTASLPVRVDTVFAVKFVPVRERPAKSAESTIASEPRTSDVPIAADSQESVVLASAVSPHAPFHQPTSAQSTTMRKADLISPPAEAPPVTFRIRTLATDGSSSEPVPQSVNDAIFPNSAFALMMPIGKGQSIGVEMGTEAWTQNFSGMEDDRQVEYTQTPVLFWMGATYQIVPMEFRFLQGLSPFIDATVGVAFAQGPIGRATVGLAYQPFGPIRFTVGLDGSALMYQYQNSWFTSSKWGMSYGISFDIGALR